MKFLVDIDIESDKDKDISVVTPEVFAQHIKDYIFAEDCGFELSLVPPGDPDHQFHSSNYITYVVTRCEVEILQTP